MRRLFFIIVLTVMAGHALQSCSLGRRAEARAQESAIMSEHKKYWQKYNANGEDDSIIIYTRPVLSRSLQDKDTLTALYCGVYIAQAWLFMEEPDSTLKYLMDMSSSIEKCQDNLVKYLYYCVYGGYALKADLNYSKAMEYYQLSYKYAEATGKVSNQLRILLDISYIFYLRSDENGMSYAQEAYKMAQAEGVSVEHKCTANMAMAMMSHISGDDVSARQYIKTAKELAEEAGLITLYSQMYKVYADIYAAEHDYREAEYYYSRALDYSGYSDAGTESIVCLDYGRMLYASGRYHKAKEMLERGLEISYRHNNHECRKELLSSLVDVELALGDKDEVMRYLGNYRLYLDSISNIQKEKEFNSILMSIQKIRYENQAQALELRNLRARQKLVYFIAVLVVLVVFVSALMLVFRKQRNTYKLLVMRYQKYAEEKHDHIPYESQETGGKNASEADRLLFERIEEMMRKDKVYKKKSITRDDLAEMLNTNRTYVSRAINRFSGKTFTDYINMWRVIEATIIMADKSNDVPLKQLAEDLGYSSLPVFHRSFQKETGVTAGKYMKELRTSHE